MKRITQGFFGKEHSFATGILLALLVWTLTRIVNAVAEAGSLEYDIEHQAARLSDGRQGAVVSVDLTNLSREPIRNIELTISDPDGRLTFVTSDKKCVLPEPGWGGKAGCDATATGFSFKAPILYPDSSARVEIKHDAADGKRPVVRILTPEPSKVRLVRPSFETFVARHETGILITLVIIVTAALFASIAKGVVVPPKPEEKGGV